MARSCLVCGSSFGPCHIPGLVECRLCRFVSADLDLPEDVIRALYNEKYFHGEEYADYLNERDSLLLSFRRRLQAIRKFVPDSHNKRLFDVGCAFGFFLEMVTPYFASAHGIDISNDAVAYARNILHVDATAGDLLTAPIGGPFDVVCMWDVIEHLGHPDRVLERVASMMPDGGILTITTGDIRSVNARLRGKRWRLIHPPTHLHYFSTQTITLLLQHHGFRVVQITHPGTYRTLRNIFFITLVLRNGAKHAYEFVDRFAILDRAVYMNLFDVMFVIARKDSTLRNHV